MALKARQVEVLRRMLTGTHHTLAELAAAVGVSSRTLQRELPLYSRWLARDGIALRVRPRRGVEVAATPEQRQRARERLAAVRPDPSLSPGERQRRILQELLQHREGLKLAYFAYRFGVTEASISGDLDRIEPWLRRRGIALMRRPGAGIHLQGDERAFRTAIVDVLRENLSDDDLYALLRRVVGGPPPTLGPMSRLLHFVDQETIVQIESAVRDLNARLEEQLIDSAVAGLVVHLALAVERLRRGEAIRFPAATLRQLRESREWPWALELARQVSADLQTEIPEDEVGYITMHLKGARLRQSPVGWSSPDPERVEALQLARAMVAAAEDILGEPLASAPGLVHGLAVHLVPAISRLRLGLEIRNPLLAQIKAEYPGLYTVAQEVAKVLEGHLGVPVSAAEVGFITMHLGAARERLRSGRGPAYRALLVCTTGVGSSQMLASRLAQALPEVAVEDVISALELPDYLRRRAESPDLILTTVPLGEVGMPVVVVSPLLPESEQAAVRRILAEAPSVSSPVTPAPPAPPAAPSGIVVAGDEPASGAAAEAAAVIGPENLMRRVAAVAPMVLDLLDRFRLAPVPEPSIAAACDLVAAAGVPHDRTTLAQDLRRREEMGSTLIDEKLQLLHARSAGVQSPFLGLLRSPHRTVVVMLMPRESMPTVREILGTVSAALVEHPEFARVLHREPEVSIKRHLGRLLQPLLFSLGSSEAAERSRN